MSENSQVRDGRGDFDFLIGRWKGHNRRLRARLKGSDSWEEFENELVVRKILNGAGNFDEGVFHRESGDLHGVTMRLYNPESGQWRIYWASHLTTELDVPMIGSFENGRGEFHAQEDFEGRSIFTRYVWIVNNADSCRWEQAFSTDGGKTWETNWTMDYTRQP